MRLQLIGLSALLLSGCAWMDTGPRYHHGGHSAYAYHHNYHAGPQPVQYRSSHGATHLDFSVAAEEFTGGNAIALRGPQGDLISNKIAFKDAYNTGARASAGIAHDVAPRTTLTVDGFYKRANGKSEIFELAPDFAGSPLYGSFSDYKSYGGEVGFREYAGNNPRDARPYIGATIGISHVEAINLERVSRTGDPAAIGAIELFESDWVPTASGLIGIDIPVSGTGTMGIETGLRYEGKRKYSGTDINGDDVYSIPIKLRGRLRF